MTPDADDAPERVGEGGEAGLEVRGVGQDDHVGGQLLPVGLEERLQRRGPDLLLALDDHLHVDGQPPRRLQVGRDRGDVHEHSRLVVDDTAAVETAIVPPRRLEGRGHPLLGPARGLDVVVGVEQHGGCALRVQPLPVHVRMPSGHGEDLAALEAGLPEDLEDLLRAPADRRARRGLRRDARDPGELDELVEVVVPARLEVIEGVVGRGRGAHAISRSRCVAATLPLLTLLDPPPAPGGRPPPRRPSPPREIRS